VREKLHEIVIAGFSFSGSGNKSVCHYFSKSTAADNSAGVYLHKYQDQKKFLPWKTWLRIAAQHKLRLVGWPDGVLSPGPDFALRKLSANNLKVLIRRYADSFISGTADDSAFKVQKWPTRMFLRTNPNLNLLILSLLELLKLAPNDPKRDTIPLVISASGKSLRILRDLGSLANETNAEDNEDEGDDAEDGRYINRDQDSPSDHSHVSTLGAHPSKAQLNLRSLDYDDRIKYSSRISKPQPPMRTLSRHTKNPTAPNQRAPSGRRDHGNYVVISNTQSQTTMDRTPSPGAFTYPTAQVGSPTSTSNKRQKRHREIFYGDELNEAQHNGSAKRMRVGSATAFNTEEGRNR
jgi:hypothetical protein